MLGVAGLALSGCGLAAQLAPVTATSGGRTVMVIGDSLSGNTVSQLPNAARDNGVDVTFVDMHANGSGLLSPIGNQTPHDFVNAKLDANPAVDAVILEWAGACQRPCSVPYGTPAFYSAWWEEAQRIVDSLAARHVMVIWAISPPPPPGLGDPNGPYDYNEQVGTALSWQSRGFIYANHLAYTDWWTALMGKDDFLGHYEKYLWYNDAIRAVRIDDSVHLTPEGSYRTAVATLASLTGVASYWSPR